MARYEHEGADSKSKPLFRHRPKLASRQRVDGFTHDRPALTRLADGHTSILRFFNKPKYKAWTPGWDHSHDKDWRQLRDNATWPLPP
jgi:hypothetical protein